ncbi:uncharacterized protein LOC144558577 isoform X2 [Carex rostrata]
MEGFKKGPWSEEEDAILLDWVAAHGPHYWSCIQSKGLLKRTGKSCRLRWVNKLRPGLKKGPKFSPEEEEKVVQLQARFGNKWARIAKSFQGRTDNDVKNFWSTRKKRLARSHRGPLPSISKNGTGVDGPEQAVTPNETPTNDQQQSEAIAFNHQETIDLAYIHQCFAGTSATPVLTGPTSKPPNIKTESSLAPFDNVMPIQQCLNGASVTPVLTLPTSKPPNTNNEPSSLPFDSVMPHQQYLHATSTTPVLTLPTIKPLDTVPLSAPFDDVMLRQFLNCTSATPVLTVPTLNVPSIKSGPSSTPFNNVTPQIQSIQSPFFDRLSENELVYHESDPCLLGCSRSCCAPLTFDDLTADVLKSF